MFTTLKNFYYDYLAIWFFFLGIIIGLVGLFAFHASFWFTIPALLFILPIILLGD